MIRIGREELNIIRTQTEEKSIPWEAYLEALLDKPSNIIYFETAGRLYGIASFGDVLKAKAAGLDRLPISKQFTCLGDNGCMRARKLFKDDAILSEIPIVEDGRLIGEFDRFDSILLLQRMRDWKYNRYAENFWRSAGKLALVRPGRGRKEKQRIYDDWCRRLSDLGAEYSCVDLADLAGREKEYDKILFVDETEMRGAKVFLELFDGFTLSFDITRTFQEICERMGETRMIDYEEALEFYRKQGVNVITLNLVDPGTQYTRRIQRECHERYPDVTDSTLNELMKKYDVGFFDDLYDPDFARTMESGFFAVEKTRSTLRLREVKSRYVNIEGGERRTVGQPEEYSHSIFFYGACLPIGAYVSDEHTMESYLQQMLNERGIDTRVVNYGSWGGNIACFGRMATSFIREGDTVVLLLEDFEMDDENALNLWEPLEKNDIPSEWLLDNPFHCNHHVMKCYAEAIFERLDLSERETAKTSVIERQPGTVKLFYTDKYFYGWEPPGGAEKICSCNINGNPFTLGHRHLLKTASEMMDHVILFSIEEKADMFTYAERFTMAYEAAKEFGNVTVVPSGVFLSNVTLFPAYYAKVYKGDVQEQAEAHIRTFSEIADILGIRYRIVGKEPHDPVTNEINNAMIALMPGFGLEPVIIDRMALDGEPITGTRVRKLAEEERFDELERYIPKATMAVIKGEPADGQ